MFNWLTKKPAAAPVAQVSELDQQINARFPPQILFRTPSHPETAKMPSHYQEDQPDTWLDMLRRYPHPPQTQDEAQQREDELWGLYADVFTVKNQDGTSSLKPKQAVLDYFEYSEKWIFRYYYAATGTIKKTIQEEIVRTCLDSRRALDRKARVLNDGTYLDSDIRQDRARTDAAFDHAVRVALPAHLAREGEWFFFNVVEAFKKRHQSKTPEDRNVHGEGGYATRGDIDRAARGLTRGTANDQQFED